MMVNEGAAAMDETCSKTVQKMAATVVGGMAAEGRRAAVDLDRELKYVPLSVKSRAAGYHSRRLTPLNIDPHGMDRPVTTAPPEWPARCVPPLGTSRLGQ
ncbi:hypothetical protein NL676_008001 [Syzygium grande]|nr:hypothetical protein NL676_008001 [Syzygium grande]